MIRIAVAGALAAALAAQPAPDPIEAALTRALLDPKQAQVEVQVYTASRVPRLPVFDDAARWSAYALKLRERLLQEIVLRGEARRWSEAATRVEWLDTLAGNGYRIRKLRYEALPGLWVPAYLYEPERVSGRVPVTLNVNGHERLGISTPYIQARLINLARKGVPSLNPEWFGRGQLDVPALGHYLLPQIDLTGTSGLAVFWLGMRRALDLLLEQPYADPARVALTGLSGGGWQTILLAALDPRIKLAAPVAGYSSFVTRAQFPELDLGDPEQTPSDFATIADYTHLTAMLAPRPALLIHNAKDNCCFRADYAVAPLIQSARPVYELLGAEPRLGYHLNHDAGHNYERDNREAFYRLLRDHFLKSFDATDVAVDAEIRTEQQLRVELPAGNSSFNSLARDLARALPRPGASATRERLREVARVRSYSLDARMVADEEREGARVSWWRLKMGDAWTVPAVEFVPRGATQTVIVTADAGRGTLAAEVRAQLARNRRVLAIDPFYFGESRIATRDFLFALLVAAVGERPLGIQASQIAAAARWQVEQRGSGQVHLLAVGPRSSLFALIAAATEERAVAGIETRGGMTSLKEGIERNLSAQNVPELFCFGLLESFDIPRIRALVEPRPVIDRSAAASAK